MNNEIKPEELDFNSKLEELLKNKDKNYEITFDSNGKPSIHAISDNVSIGVKPEEILENEKEIDESLEKIEKMLPFLKESTLKEIAEKILNDDPNYKDVSLSKVVCFMNQIDTDELFFSLLNGNDDRYKIIIPFVSNDALSKVTKLYLEGNCQSIDMDLIYPFLNEDDLKLVFEHALESRNKNR